VAGGLDSVAVGEEQILGQVRSAIRLAAEHGAIGRALGDLGRLALRAGKRARAETGIARTGGTLLSLAIEAASASPPTPAGTAVGASLAGRDVLVAGAGTMSALAVATASRDGAASLVLVNRTRRRAERLAARSGVAPTRPRDVEPTVARLPGVAVIGLDMLAQQGTVAGATTSQRYTQSWRPRWPRISQRPTPHESPPRWPRCGPRRPAWPTPNWPGWPTG
jgi:glutamyl-tRNA reductase